jgi:hypothetical protein
METTKYNFEIVFESLEEYQNDPIISEALGVYNESKTIFEQTDYFKSFQQSEPIFDSIGFTKA